MPAAIPAIAAAFVSAGTAVASTIGLSAATSAAVGAAAGNAALALGFASGIGAGLSAWGTVFAVGSAISTLSMTAPKPISAGVQLDTKFDANAPRTVAFGRTAVGGSQIYMGVSGEKNVRLSRVFGLSVGPIDSIESFSAADYGITWNHDPTHTLAECVATTAGAGSKLFVQNFRQGHHLGDPSNPIPPQTMTGTFMPELTGNSQFRGIAYAIQHLDYHPRDSFPAGDPKSGGFEWVGKWKTVWDPRKDTSYPGGLGDQRWADISTHRWSENPAIIALNYALGIWQNGKRLAGFGAPIQTIDVASFLHAANLCDARGWTCGGEYSTSDDPYAVLTTILQAASAIPINNNGVLSCFANAPKASVFTLGQSDVVGAVEIVNSTAWRDRKNTIRPFYREESQQWEIINGQSVSATTYIAEDRGEVRAVEVSYPYVQKSEQAHQLAAYELCTTREFLQFTLTCKPRLLAARVGDCITVNLPDVAAPNQTCIVVSRSFDPQTWRVTLTLRAESPGKHAWALDQSQEAPSSPSLNGSYNGFDPDGPLDSDGFPSWTIIGNKVERDGVIMPAMIVGGAVADDDPNVAEIIVDYREFGSAEDAWINHNTAVSSTTRFEIVGLKPAQSYYVSVRYRTVLGVYTPRLILGPATSADLKIDAGKIDFLEALGTASLAEFAEAVNEATDAANEAAASVSTLIDDVGLLSETSIEQSLRDTYLKDYTTALTHLEGVPVGTAITTEKNERIEGDTALAETFDMIGSKSGDGLSFIIDTSRAKVSPTESLAERFSALVAEAGEEADSKILEERSVWTDGLAAQAATTTLLDARVGDAEAAITTEATSRVEGDESLAQTLSLLGAENEAGTAFVLDNSKVEISPGQTLASRLTSLESASDTNSASITSLSTTVTTNASATATSISTLTATTGAHTSSISLLNSASSSYGTKTVLSTNVNGHVAGTALLNGGSGASSFIVQADKFVVASTAGGVAQAPFVISGSTVYMDNVVARNIGANTITADQIIGGAVSTITTTSSAPSLLLSTGAQAVLSWSHANAGGKMVINVSCRCSNSSGGKAGVRAVLYRNGSYVDEDTFMVDPSFTNSGAFTFFDQPGSGNHTYSVQLNLTSGSGTPVYSVANRAIATELKR